MRAWAHSLVWSKGEGKHRERERRGKCGYWQMPADNAAPYLGCGLPASGLRVGKGEELSFKKLEAQKSAKGLGVRARASRRRRGLFGRKAHFA